MALTLRFLVNFLDEIKPRDSAHEILASQTKFEDASVGIETLKSLTRINDKF